jgi:hypothetical protein
MSKLSDPRSFSKLVAGLSLIGAPLLLLLSAVCMPAVKSHERAQVAVIAAHPERYYLFAILILASSILMVPALLGLMHLVRERAPRWGIIGGSLSILGALVAIADCGGQLVIWQMGARGADPAQMAALLKRYDDALGSSLPFTIGGLAVVVGAVVLGIGLYRARSAPAWAAAGLPVGMVLNVAGFASGSIPVLVVSGAVLLVALGSVGLRVLRSSDEQWEHAADLTRPPARPTAPVSS